MKQKVDFVEDFAISASEELFESSDTLKYKVAYIAKFLVLEYGSAAEPNEDTILNDFVEELNREGLYVRIFGIAFFVHCAVNLYSKLQEPRKNRGSYVSRLSTINSPMARNELKCHALKNITYFVQGVCIK